MAAIYGKVLGETSSAKLLLKALGKTCQPDILQALGKSPQFVLYELADRTVTYRQAPYIV